MRYLLQIILSLLVLATLIWPVFQGYSLLRQKQAVLDDKIHTLLIIGVHSGFDFYPQHYFCYPICGKGHGSKVQQTLEKLSYSHGVYLIMQQIYYP